MDQNMNQQQNNPQVGERTFTQEQVNAIVSERLSKEKAKSESALAEKEQQFAQREKELANREALIDLKERLREMNLPEELIPVLNVTDKDALENALEALRKQMNTDSEYKIIPNRLKSGNTEADILHSQLEQAMKSPETKKG